MLAPNENGNGETAERRRQPVRAARRRRTWKTTFIATLSSEDSPEWEGAITRHSALDRTRIPERRYLAFMSPRRSPAMTTSTRTQKPKAHATRRSSCMTPPRRACAASPAILPARDPTGRSTRRSRGRPRAARRPPRGLARTLARGQHSRLDGAEPHQRAVSVALPLRRRTPVLQQSRRSGPRSDQPQRGCLRVRAHGRRQLPEPLGWLRVADLGGSSDRESAFLEATPDGSNVFFLTEAHLLPQDTDTAFDIYDARECTALSPCLTPPAAPSRAVR